MNIDDKTNIIFPYEVNLDDKKTIIVRMLLECDGEILGKYFSDLSETTRGFYGPHPLNYEEGIKICKSLTQDAPNQYIIVIAAQDDRIIGYFILRFGIIVPDKERYIKYGIMLDSQTDCTLAPSIADDYQNKSLGSKIFPQVINFARKNNKRRMILWGGVKAENSRAVHFYEKFGFYKISEFEYMGTNFDMLLNLL